MNIPAPVEVKKIWARRRLMPWFRAKLIAWLYEYAKKHMSKHSRVYSVYQQDIRAANHRNAVTTAVKKKDVTEGKRKRC